MRKIQKYLQVQINEMCGDLKKDKEVTENMKTECVSNRNDIQECSQQINDLMKNFENSTSMFDTIQHAVQALNGSQQKALDMKNDIDKKW